MNAISSPDELEEGEVLQSRRRKNRLHRVDGQHGRARIVSDDDDDDDAGGSAHAAGATSSAGEMKNKRVFGGDPIFRRFKKRSSAEEFRSLTKQPIFAASKAKCIVFCETRLWTYLVCQYFRMSGLCYCEWMTSAGASTTTGLCNLRMTKADHQRKMNLFRKDFQLMCATSVLQEGIDVPSCNAVIRLTDPSTCVENIQCRGRARLYPASYCIMKSRETGILGYKKQDDHDKITKELPKLIKSVNKMTISPQIADSCADAVSAVYVKTTGAYVSRKRAKTVLQRVLSLLYYRKGSDGHPVEQEMHSAVGSTPCYTVIKREYNQSPTEATLSLPPVRGYRTSAYKLTAVVAFDMKRRDLDLESYLEIIRKFHEKGVIDDHLLPPMSDRATTQFEDYFMRKLFPKQPKLIEDLERLWREVPLSMLRPKLSKRDLVLSDVALKGNVHLTDEKLRERRDVGAFEECSSTDAATAQTVTEGDTLHPDTTAKSDTTATAAAGSTAAVLSDGAGNAGEQCAKRDGIVDSVPEKSTVGETVDMYVHRVFYTVYSLNSEVLASGGLYGYWREYHDAAAEGGANGYAQLVDAVVGAQRDRAAAGDTNSDCLAS
eukprot:Lankesteria_metandrocarpae@DN759_c0_g1_i1.p1